MLVSTFSGRRILLAELVKSSNPINIITIDTIKPDIYSPLPCPNGCSLSAFLPVNLNPARVIIEEPASDKLLNASAVIATEPLNIPAKYLKAKRSIHYWRNVLN